MNLRGRIVEVSDEREVETQYGTRSLAEVSIRPGAAGDGPIDAVGDGSADTTDADGDALVRVTLWGKWTHTADLAEPGMDLLVTDAEESEYRGEPTYSTAKESYVVLEPDFLVDVTDIRSWVQCPRMYYLNKLSGIPLNYPVVKGTIVHEVFGDLLRGRDLDDAIEERVAEAGLQLGLLGYDATEVEDEVRRNAAAIEGWLAQGTLTEEDEWRSEYTLISPTFGIKGRADALRRGMPVELKTGKNLKRDPRFQDKIQAAAYALVLDERGVPANTGTLLYTKNTALERHEESGDLSPAKEFSIGNGLLEFVVRTRNEIAAMEFDTAVPTGFEADANCEYCFEQDTCMVVSGRLDQESKAGKIGKPLPEDEREYFDRIYRAIEEERRETHAEYRKLWEQSAAERADDDRALIGLEPLDQREIEGQRWELTAKKPDGAVSKLREGDVCLASNGDPVGGHAELCRIRELGDRVVVTADEPVELRRLDVYPSEISVSRMLTAVHDALLKGDSDRKDVLFGRRDPAFTERSEATYIDNNDAQNEAVKLAVDAEDFALVHGPPGTGKTYTIARIVRALVADGNRVLLSAFTNRAVDNALEALRDQGFADAVRVGTENGIREDMQDLHLKTTGDPNDRVAELTDAPVVAATTSSCGSRVMREQSFDVALVDEASQLTEPGTLAAINRADRFVLVGDHEQLPPVVRAENDLQQSLFERLIDAAPEASVMLDRQYRMSQRIQAFSSAEFYDGALRPATGEVAAQRLSDLGVDESALPEPLRDPVAFIDPNGSRVGNTNPVEAERVAELVETFVAAGVEPDDIGVIAPFRAQVAEIGKRTDVTVDTVDRFQGSSKEVVIVSFVASGTLDGPIFEDHRRINVALTRAKKSLVLVGDANALESDPFYARMLEWARR
ncbi:DNA/RNA helicase, superfamily i [Halogeometricum borinquense DSM 11551]|uniref:DNA helicase n=2 Tax=Halogeometricum borinquense TaxID=60847 RepID=E4NR92_HALBP|nr:AAA domain-containing protein [Halogeometricum borinquense]ADQ66828.1 DNA/RNA helicase, superfamily I [Halogeometricum borinquense DSM 11551]ELY30336.1 DNA/RNA helicase, superfamily i [Halogeometricum borinquense DSM 11551]RYJ15390.1 AAA family ATPase [Halogeometricum borinquense]